MKLTPISFDLIKLRDNFWAPRQKLLNEKTLFSQYMQLEISGRIFNFNRVNGDLSEPFRGLYFNESDVYKWIEASAYSLYNHPNEKILNLVNELIKKIVSIQQLDGYINTYFVGEKAHLRWSDLRDKHELYCAGHLIQAAIAVHRYLGTNELLTAANRFADLIVNTFGESGFLPNGVPGHPEIEMALIDLYRHTGEEKYLNQALRFINNRGHAHIGGGEYYLDHKPVRELSRMYGHAVRAVYLNSAIADLYLETGDKSLLYCLEKMWNHLVNYQMYITGGIGSRHEGEAFGDDYELPDQDAYAETCAAIGKIIWDWRMLLISGDAKYADDLETTLFNAMLVGIGLDGESYHYSNPLESDYMYRRQPWFAVSCCPPNIARILASVSGFFYSISEEGIWVNLYGNNSCDCELPNGTGIHLKQDSNYPWEGHVRLQINSDETFAIFLRIPGWCTSGATLTINGEIWTGQILPQSYLRIMKKWHIGDEIELDLPMQVRQIIANPKIEHLKNKIALTNGPIVYCFESVDQFTPGINNIILVPEPEFAIEYAGKELGFVKKIKMQGLLKEGPRFERKTYLYSEENQNHRLKQTITVTAVPYFAWGNREYGNMQVWIRKSQ